MSDTPSPTDWRLVEPKHTAAIDASTDRVMDALNRLLVTTGDLSVVATPTGYVIGRLRGWLDSEVEIARE